MPVGQLKDIELVIQKVLAGESLESLEKDLSDMFEFVATKLSEGSLSRVGEYFDGVVGLTAAVKSSRKVEFNGEMWVGSGSEQWTEPLHAVLVDNRIDKKGIQVVLQIGEDRLNGEITSLFPESNHPS